ncbi:MAG: hypothetical protein HY402_03995 [Elusimicrobia bacterium]|nr:hypothetical protein [Elusimicrobiota bacterium]
MDSRKKLFWILTLLGLLLLITPAVLFLETLEKYLKLLRPSPPPLQSSTSQKIPHILPLLFLFCLPSLAGCRAPAPLSAPGKFSAPPAQLAPGLKRLSFLWIPAEENWDPWLRLLEEQEDLRMTLAVPSTWIPEDPDLLSRLQTLERLGQLEIAFRIPQDPVLPMIADLHSPEVFALADKPPSNFKWPQDARMQLSWAHKQMRDRLSQPPAGFVPGAGALTPEFWPLLAQENIAWTAVGKPRFAPEETPEIQEIREGLRAVHFTPLTWTEKPPAHLASELVREGTPQSLFVLDETIFFYPPNFPKKFLQALAEAIYLKPELQLLRVQDRLPEASPPPSTLPAFLPWTGDYSLWIGNPQKNAAWELLAQARTAAQNYQNSGLAKIENLDAALQEIYQAESGHHFAAFGQPPSPETEKRERAFRAGLMNIYRLMGLPIPEALYHPLSEFRIAEKASNVLNEPLQENLHNPFQIGKNKFRIQDPEGDLLLQLGNSNPEGGDILAFSGQWSQTQLQWTLEMAHLPSSTQELPLVDIYIDLNHRVGAGAAELLPGRALHAPAEDAWEYALVFHQSSFTLYQSGTWGKNRTIYQAQAQVLPESSQIQFSIPREVLRGNPKRWGYTVLTLPASPSSSEIPMPLSAQELPAGWKGRPPILDILDPTSKYQQHLETSLPTARTLPALRLPE